MSLAEAERLLADVGCVAGVHARAIEGDAEVGFGADVPYAPASVVKVLIAVTVEDAVARGDLHPAQRIRLGDDLRTPGPVGLSLFEDDAECSVRDLVTLMLTISDNVATDALTALVGLDRVAATASRLGLAGTHVGEDLRATIEGIAHDTGFGSWSDLSAWTPADADDQARFRERLASARAFGPDASTRTTARDQTALLRAVWTDTAAAPEACARVRSLMAQQLVRARIASGFGADVPVAAKSGGLVGVVRHEVGVVSPPGRPPVAVAVLTRAATAAAPNGGVVDRAIGHVAAMLVDEVTG